MPLTEKQKDATSCALKACRRVGLYKGLSLTLPQFRARRCSELVTACDKSCPISPADYNTCLITFREALRACLKEKGYKRPLLYLVLLCAKSRIDDELVPWTWGDWCDHLAARLTK